MIWFNKIQYLLLKNEELHFLFATHTALNFNVTNKNIIKYSYYWNKKSYNIIFIMELLS